jgi:hypothetical protein
MKVWIQWLAVIAVLGIGLPVMAAKEKSAKKGESETVQGQIVSIHADHSDPKLTDIKITAHGKKRGAVEDVVVTADANTKVTIDGQDATLADLKTGERCKISGTDGKASAIEVSTGKGKGKKGDK